MDVKLLRPVFPCALGVMDNDLFHHLMEDQRRKLLYVRILSDKPQEAGSVHSAFLILVDLRSQSGDFLVRRKPLAWRVVQKRLLPMGKNKTPSVIVEMRSGNCKLQNKGRPLKSE